MAITAKELREKRSKLIKDARAIYDKAEAEKRDQTAEERGQWAAIMGGVDADGKRVVGEEEKLKGEIERLERMEGSEAEMRAMLGSNKSPGKEDGKAGGTDHEKDVRDNTNIPTEEQRALAFQGWVRAQAGMEVKDQHVAACRAVGVSPNVKELPISLQRGDYQQIKARAKAFKNGQEFRAGAANPQSVGILTSGGYTVPEGFVANLEAALLQYGGIRGVADVMRTTSGNDLPWPTINDTTVKGSILNENGTVSTADMSFGVVTFHAYKYTSKLILVPVELIEDSAFDLANFIGDACGIRIGRIQADHFTTGTGAGQPLGALSAATLGVTAAIATAISADDIYTLEHSVDPAYRATGCAWSFHDQILLAIKKLKDGFGRYLWQASLAGGQPDTLSGYPIIINQSMPSTIVSTNKTMLFGQHDKYKIRDVAEVRLRRLVERYADADQEGFVMFMRSDGNLLDAGTHPLKYMQH